MFSVDDSADVFGEKDELFMAQPRRQQTGGLRQRPPPVSMPSSGSVPSYTGRGLEEIEMKTPRAFDTFEKQG